MNTSGIPGELPHVPPAKVSRERLSTLRPYVREAQEGFRPTWHIKPRKLFDFLLVHVVDGSGSFSIGRNTGSVSVGDLLWIPPDTLHELYGDAPGTRLQYLHFDLIYDPGRSHWSAHVPGGTFDLSPWSERVHPPVEDPIIAGWCGRLEGFNTALVTELMRRIVLEYNRAQTCTLAATGGVLQLIGHLLGSQHNDSALDARHAKTIENAMQQIQLHSDRELNIEILARQHGLSTTHFRRLFREYYRQSPRAAHHAAKMRRACDDLIYSDLTITEIADRLGFTNVHNFSRAFHKAIGQPPSTYRAGQSSGKK